MKKHYITVIFRKKKVLSILYRIGYWIERAKYYAEASIFKIRVFLVFFAYTQQKMFLMSKNSHYKIRLARTYPLFTKFAHIVVIRSTISWSSGVGSSMYEISNKYPISSACQAPLASVTLFLCWMKFLPPEYENM